MQVDNSHQISFGRLMINKSIAQKLKKYDPEILDRVIQAGEELEEKKIFNVEINHSENYLNDLKCTITSNKDAYFGLYENGYFKDIRYGKNKNTLILDNAYIIEKRVDDGFPNAVYNIRDAAGMLGLPQIDVISKIAKELNDVATKYAKAQEMPAENAVAKKINYLLDNFGV